MRNNSCIVKTTVTISFFFRKPTIQYGVPVPPKCFFWLKPKSLRRVEIEYKVSRPVRPNPSQLSDRATSGKRLYVRDFCSEFTIDEYIGCLQISVYDLGRSRVEEPHSLGNIS